MENKLEIARGLKIPIRNRTWTQRTYRTDYKSHSSFVPEAVCVATPGADSLPEPSSALPDILRFPVALVGYVT